VPDAADEDENGDVVGSCPAGGGDVVLGALADGAEDGLAALEKALVGLISEEKDDDACFSIKNHLDVSKLTDFNLNHN
jgi:hypothetical protein